ncbi:glycosyltransferase family 2 protein [uncultured Ruthenibacterium sp.]|mgnify:CR=1 FL=1|uniref:glycosyltransferase family 2 protein n=1 Tax=uncultured Ruthenibacterium sp. TaxID=1905347 RepID=UPI00349EA619
MAFLVLTRIVMICSILLGIYTLYFGAIALVGLFRRTKSVPSYEPSKRFACVIAARNEALVIGNLVDSLRKQNYPTDLFEVIVAPNNCTDETESIALAHGARIFTAHGTIRSKGEVLTQIVDEVILQERFDAMCVFDADNLVDENFLQRMNDALCNGAQVAQGFRDSKNPEQSAISGCYSICYWMLNRFYNGARATLGLSSLINGSGFAVTTDLLRKLGGWHTCTMTEDYEFSAQCAIAGGRVDFIPDAVIYDEQPLTFTQSWRQRRRWTTGSLQGLQTYGSLLFREMVLRRSVICFDMYLTFLTPFAQLAGAILGLTGTILLLAGKGFVIGSIFFNGIVAALILTVGGLILSGIGTAAAAAITVMLKKDTLHGMGWGIATFWMFALSHMVLTLLSFVKKENVWRPIAHTSVKTLDDVAKIR